MKSEYGNRKTLGAMLNETHDDHATSTPIEVGELSHEGGKSYMNQLIDVIEDHREKCAEYYIQVFSQKERYAGNRVLYFRFFARLSRPTPKDDTDCWYVNNRKDILNLEWSIPHRSDFSKFLANEESYDKDLIKWIKSYKANRYDMLEKQTDRYGN